MTTLDDEPSTLDAELQNREKNIVDKMMQTKYKRIFDRIEEPNKFKKELKDSEGNKEVRLLLGEHMMKLNIFIKIVKSNLK